MGWSFRKSKSFGPLRFSLSSRGLGMSLGVKGARISMNSRGTYVNLGANGIYYRQQLGGRNSSNSFRHSHSSSSKIKSQDEADDEAMNQLTDSGSQQLINELEAKATKRSFLKLAIAPLCIGFLLYLSYITQPVMTGETYKTVFTVTHPNANIRKAPDKHAAVQQMVHSGSKWDVKESTLRDWITIYYLRHPEVEGFIHRSLGTFSQELDSRQFQSRMDIDPLWKAGVFILLIALFLVCVWLYRWDKKRKTMHLNYTMEEEVRGLHEKFLTYFNEFASSAKIWQQLSSEEVMDRRRNAGAGYTITRTAIMDIRSHQLPSPHLITNIAIPYIKLADKEIFFFPERIIYRKGRQLGGVFYKNIIIKQSESRFIEHEQPASDVQVVDKTWKYLNKNGEPDRRFSDNRQLPICLYSEYALTSTQGWNETIITSRNGAMDHFAEFIRAIGAYQQKQVSTTFHPS